MANAHEQEDMEVAENPGESPEMNDLNIVINGKNDEYIIIIIFRVIFYKRKFRDPPSAFLNGPLPLSNFSPKMTTF